MIKLIGIKRMLVLTGIIAINLAFAAIYFFVINPLHTETQASLQTVNADISKKSQDIQNIKSELQQYPDRFAQYQALEGQGFFRPQDRFETGRSLEGLKEQSGVLTYRYQIDALKEMDSPQAAKAKSSLISSRIVLDNVTAVLDRNVYALIYNLQTAFPQHTRIHSFTLSRKRDTLDQKKLQDISTGKTALVEARIVMDWLTVIPAAENDTKGKDKKGFRGR